MGSHLSFYVNTTPVRWGQAEWCAWEKGEQRAWRPEFSICVNGTPGSEHLHLRTHHLGGPVCSCRFIGQEESPPISHKDMKSDRNGSSP